MEQKRNTPPHYAIGTPWAVTGEGGVTPATDRNPATYSYPLSIDDAVCNMFSSLSISPGNRRYLPESYSGEYGGAGAPIEGDFGGKRFYSGVGQSTHVTVDPHHHQYHNNNNHHLLYNTEVGSSRFDPRFDFVDQRFDFVDQRFDLLNKEQQKLNNPYYCYYSHSGILDETYVSNSTINTSLRFSRFVNDDNDNDNDNVASSKLTNYQLLSRLCLKELRGRIVCLAKDQNGCRLLQAKFENPTKEEIEIVLYEVLDSITDLMKDQFANYLIQKLIPVCNDDHKLRILLSLTDVPVEMVLVCMSPHGTRAMQKLLENLTVPYHIALAMAALRPGAARLANDANGHHVIQYCLIHFSSNFSEPILNEIAHKCYEVATDRSGCCVLQACMEHSHGEVRNRLVAEILTNAIHLAEDPYGNYVLQHMVGLNVPEFTARLVRQLQGNFPTLACNKYASNVVEKCLNESGEKFSRIIVMELITSQNPSKLLIDPYANFVIQSALTVSKGFEYDCLLELISDNMSSMRSNLYGKKILAWFEKRKILGI